ncbi:MAG: flippase [Ilumatobacteraceae bacterium]
MSVLSKNVASLLASQVATWFVSAAFLVIVPSRFGADDFGEFQLVLAFIGFFTLAGSLGTNIYLLKEVARDYSTAGRLVVDAIEMKLVMGVVLAVCAVGLGKALGYTNEVLVLIAIASVGMIATIVNEVFVAGLAGMERMAGTALWGTLQVYLGNGIGILVALTSRSLPAFAVGFAVATVIPLIGNFYAIRPLLHGRAGKFGTNWKKIARGGIPLFILSAVNLLYGTIDIPILESISGRESVGYYGLAYRWVGMPIFVTTVVASAFMPRMSALAHEAPGEFANLVNRAIKIVMVVTVPAAVGLIAVSTDLLNLVYGDEYDRAAVLMQILGLHLPIAALDTILAIALIASDRQNRYLIIAVAAAVVNPVLNIIAIRVTEHRYGNGAIGAAIVTGATELFIMCCAMRLRSRSVMDRRTVIYIGKCVAAVLAMAGALWMVRSTHLFVKIPVGAVVYGGASLVLGTVSVARVAGVMKEIGRGRQRTTNP